MGLPIKHLQSPKITSTRTEDTPIPRQCGSPVTGAGIVGLLFACPLTLANLFYVSCRHAVLEAEVLLATGKSHKFCIQ